MFQEAHVDRGFRLLGDSDGYPSAGIRGGCHCENGGSGAGRGPEYQAIPSSRQEVAWYAKGGDYQMPNGFPPPHVLHPHYGRNQGYFYPGRYGSGHATSDNALPVRSSSLELFARFHHRELVCAFASVAKVVARFGAGWVTLLS